MGISRKHSHGDRGTAAAASEWLERLPKATPAERQEFLEWLKQSPVHVREVLLNDFLDNALARFDSKRKLSITPSPADSNVIPLTERIPPCETRATPPCGAQRRWLAGMAAVLTTMVIALVYLWWGGNAKTYETGVGEQRTIALSDGSLVALNVKTVLEVSLTPEYRDLHLLAGQALFTVAHDPNRPFRVHVNGTTVNAIGTKFDLRRAGEHTLVFVMEGRVRIEQPELASLTVTPVQSPRMAAVELTPGLSAIIRQDGEVDPPAKVNVEAMSAWQSRRLVFEERSLAEIANEFSAYVRSPTVIVESAELDTRLYTGSFDADRLDNFISYLERDPSLAIVRDGDRVVVRSAGLQ